MQPTLTDRSRNETSLPAVLCVDDDVNILDGFRRLLRNKYRLDTAASPHEGLEAVSSSGPFGVILSDFQMHGMNGIEFLSRVRSIAPDSVRIMLTGQGDFSTAMGAVNQGNIFRFLVKPCLPLILEKVLDAGFEQHRLIIAEKQLTQETLLGCVKAMVEVLSIVQPEAFSRSNRARRYLKQIAEGMGITVTWQLEAAAMLSQIGWITLSPDLLAKAAAHQPLSEEEQGRFDLQASAAARILEKIPRLDQVAKIIERQQLPFKDPADEPLPIESDPVETGALLLKAAIDFDSLRHSGLRDRNVLERMRASGTYRRDILDAVTAIERTEAQDEIRTLPFGGLRPGMILEDELHNNDGALLLGAGQEIPASFLERLKNYSYGLTPDHVCKVRIRPAAGLP
jgi:response regulator RpfG family c-di-GMP phosphodiesterase